LRKPEEAALKGKIAAPKRVLTSPGTTLFAIKCAMIRG